MKHELDDDAVCIHCGHDACEERHLARLGYVYPPTPCPVRDEAVRQRNYRAWQAERDQYDDYVEDQAGWR